MFPKFKGSDGHVYEVVRGINNADAPGEFAPVPPSSWCSGGDACAVHAFGVAGTADVAWAFIFDQCKARKVKLTPIERPIHEIAREIRLNWKKVYFGAVPYLDALRSLTSVRDNYGLDAGESIVAYFLANATTYRGALAKAHKAELQALLKK